MNYDKSDIPNGGEQCKDRAYGIRKLSTDDCSAFARWRVTIEPRWLRRFSLSLSLAFFFFLLLSPMIIHVRGARHDRQSILRNDTLPLPPFRSVDDDSTCQRVVSLFPAMETEKEGKNDHALSVPTILNSMAGGFRIWGENGVGFCLWKTRGWAANLKIETCWWSI